MNTLEDAVTRANGNMAMSSGGVREYEGII